MTRLLRSFKPACRADARVLVLGTMPGPEALRRGEYYGFPGNHFWKILPAVFPPKADASPAGGEYRFKNYREKIRFLMKNRIGLWDVIASCKRKGALDSAIRCIAPNDIPGLLRRRPGIRTIILNGKTAEKLYRKHYGAKIALPAHTMPSTSPAHASMSLREKTKRWRLLRRITEER